MKVWSSLSNVFHRIDLVFMMLFSVSCVCILLQTPEAAVFFLSAYSSPALPSVTVFNVFQLSSQPFEVFALYRILCHFLFEAVHVSIDGFKIFMVVCCRD